MEICIFVFASSNVIDIIQNGVHKVIEICAG